MKQVLRWVLLLLTLPAGAQTYSGTLSTSSPSFDSPEPNGANPPAGYARGTYYYQLFSVPVTIAGPYTFEGTTNFLNGSEGILYQDPGPVPDASQTIGASVTNSLLAAGSARPNFTLTKTLAVGQYYFAVSTYAERITGDFTLTITGPTALPVHLTSFTAQLQAQGVRVNWTTASEYQHAFFRVERSLDAQQWQVLTQVASQGTQLPVHAYNWLDATAPNGTVYYRLRQVDLNGQVAYSPVVSIVKTASEVSFFPNPVINQVTFTSPHETTLILSDALGRTCQVLPLPFGQQQFTLEKLSAGLYWLTEPTTHHVLRLIKAVP
jgi:hypothetical protein